MLRSPGSENDWGPNCSRLKGTEERHGKYEQCTILGWIFCYKRHYWVSYETSMESLDKGRMGVLCTPVWLFYEIEIISLYKGKKKKESHTWLHSSCSQHWNHCCFSSDTGVIYQSMIWKYVCLLSYRGIRKIETDPCLRQQNLILYILEDTTRDLLRVAISSNDQ